ncbi:MAG: META domain-containing protein [Chitinophagaceae bacterium]|nr:META domain-containing protein [Anaerolineae bacterium]
MKFKSGLLVLFILSIFVLFPAMAQNGATNTVSFNGFSFNFDSSLGTNVNISQYPGDPIDLEQPGGPDAPHTQFLLYNEQPAPESLFDAPVGIRVYRTTDLANYPALQDNVVRLQTLLTDRSDLAPSMAMVAGDNSTGSELPYLPVQPAAQVIRARAQYVDTGVFSGLSYITVYRQDASPFLNNEFVYTFQGLSADGMYYVSAIFRLTTDLFPETLEPNFDYEAFITGINDYLTQSVMQLNAATPENFTPSLTTFDGVVQSFALAGAPQTVNPANPTPLPEATSEANADATLGGLAGVTWTLLTYGGSDAPQPVIVEAPITVVFTEEGMSGSGGCNSYGGIFQYDNNNLTFSDIFSTQIACAEPILAQEMAYFSALSTARTYEIIDDQLQIFYEGGVLTFTSGTPSI